MTALLGRASIGFVPTGCCATHRVLRDGLRACQFGAYFYHRAHVSLVSKDAPPPLIQIAKQPAPNKRSER